MTKEWTSKKDSRRAAVLTIESKTNAAKQPVKIVIEESDPRREEERNGNESDFKEDEQNQIHFATEGTKVSGKNGSDDKVTVPLNISMLERHIRLLQSKSSLSSLESFESLESNECSLVELVNDNNVQEEILETPKLDLGDHIINTLIVKRRKMMMDQDEEDVISFEESEIRIINLLISFSLIFSIVICPLLFLHFQRIFQSSLEGRATVLKEQPLNFLEPKLTLLDKGTGMITTFAWKNQTLTKDWEKPLPLSTDYFPYFDNGYLNIIYGDGVKGMTYIDVKSPRNCHRILRSGKLFFELCDGNTIYCDELIDLQTLKVGNFLLLFGGEKEFGGVNYQIMLWNMKRHKWFKGIHLPTGISEYTEGPGTWTYNSYGYNTRQMCGIAVNDSIAALFGLKEAYNQTNCRPNTLIDCDFHWEDKLTKFTLDLKTGKWVEIDTKFHSFSDFDHVIVSNWIFACDSTFSKELDL